MLFDHQNRDAAVSDLPDHPEDLLHDDRGQPEGRLIEDQQLGTGHECFADGQHLTFASAQGPGELGLALGQAGKRLVYLVECVGS